MLNTIHKARMGLWFVQRWKRQGNPSFLLGGQFTVIIREAQKTYSQTCNFIIYSQWFSTRHHLPRAQIDVWRCIWLSTMRVLLASSGQIQGCCYTSYNAQDIIWSKMSVLTRLRNAALESKKSKLSILVVVYYIKLYISILHLYQTFIVLY